VLATLALCSTAQAAPVWTFTLSGTSTIDFPPYRTAYCDSAAEQPVAFRYTNAFQAEPVRVRMVARTLLTRAGEERKVLRFGTLSPLTGPLQQTVTETWDEPCTDSPHGPRGPQGSCASSGEGMLSGFSNQLSISHDARGRYVHLTISEKRSSANLTFPFLVSHCNPRAFFHESFSDRYMKAKRVRAGTLTGRRRSGRFRIVGKEPLFGCPPVRAPNCPDGDEVSWTVTFDWRRSG